MIPTSETAATAPDPFEWLKPASYARWFRPLMTLIFVGGTLLLLLSSLTGDSPDLIVGDGRGYFEYARSLMIEGRLPREHIRYPCGVSLIGLVGYAPSIGISEAAGWLEGEREAAGWGVFNQFMFCLPLIGLAALGMLANLRLLEHLGFEAAVARFTLLVWFVGTNVPYYIFKEPAMSESATYSTLSIYYYLLLWAAYRRESGGSASGSIATDLRIWLGIGLVLGVASIVRQQNALHGLALVLLVGVVQGRRWREQPSRALAVWLRAIVPAAVVALAVFTIPYYAWAASDEGAKTYAYGREAFHFLNPHPFVVLFSPRLNGLFVWTPLYAVAAVGWICFFRRHRTLIAPLLVMVLLQYYLIASWWAPSFGSSVGHRGFFTILPLLLPGLAALVQAAKERQHERAMTALLLLFCALNVVYLLLVSSGVIVV